MTYARSCSALFRVLVGVLALAAFSVASARTGYGPVITPAPNGFNIKFSRDGTPMAVPANTATGVTYATPVNVPVGPTAMAAVAMTAGITGAAMGGPWGAAVGAIGAVGVFAIPAFADAYTRAKMRVNPTTGAMEKADPAVCSVAPCNGYWYRDNAMGRTYLDACIAGMNSVNASGTYFLIASNPRISGTSCLLDFYRRADGTFYNTNTDILRTVASYYAPLPVSWISSSVADGVAAISAQVPTAAQVEAMQIIGYDPMPGAVTVTGPASIPDTNVVKTGVDGSSTTEACSFYLEYFPSNIAAHPQCTTTTVTPPKTETHTETTTNPDGTTSTKTVAVTTPGKTDVVVTNKDKPVDTRTDCEKYPDNAACQKLGDAPTADVLKNVSNAVSVTSVAFAGGSCPPPISFSVMGRSYGFTYTEMCARLALLKWLFITMAGVIAAWILADTLKV